MEVLNFSTKIKRKEIVKSGLFKVEKYPGSIKGYLIRINLGEKDWYLDHSLTLNSSWECAGIWPTEQKAHLFILNKFYN